MTIDQTTGGHNDEMTTEDLWRLPRFYAQAQDSSGDDLTDTSNPGLRVRPRAIATELAPVLRDVALTVLQNPRRVSTTKITAMAAILSGGLGDFEPARFREVITMLVGSAYGSSLDAIAGHCGLTRGVILHTHGQFAESDASLQDRVFRELQGPAASSDDQLVGISIRTVLHFCPEATLNQQEAAIAKTIKAVEDEIVRTEVDQTIRVNDLWMTLRLTCHQIVIDIGEPNRPFEEILLWREGKPEPLNGNYIVQPGERLIVEPSLPAAIDIRPAVGRPRS